MGTRIKAVSIAKPVLALFHRGSIDLSADALRLSLEKLRECHSTHLSKNQEEVYKKIEKEIEKDKDKEKENPINKVPAVKPEGSGCLDYRDVGVLINTGIYREDNIGEPALASLIQKKAGLNRLYDGEHGTFAFDLYNGAAGPLNALMLIDSFVSSGRTKMGAVVSCDTIPFTIHSENFPFDPVAASVILGNDAHEGFAAWFCKDFPKYKKDFWGSIEWKNVNGKMKHVLVIMEKPEYVDHLVECIDVALREFLEKHRIDSAGIDLVLTSQYPPTLPERLNSLSPIKGKVLDLKREYGLLHTVGILASLYKVYSNGRFASARNILFIGAGAGISVILGLYKN
ncbi:MAG: hypothetical protein QW728_00440 [Thermoplasmata archaeon]